MSLNASVLPVETMTARSPGQPPLVVMLTADRQIDRRILQEADSLETAGWRVVIVAMPLDPGMTDTDPRVVRVSIGSKAAVREARILPIYRWVRRLMPMNSALMRFMKAIAWRLFVDQDTFYVRLFEETIARYKPTVFVGHDLPMLPVACLAARRTGAKLVYDSHELYCEQGLSGWEKRRWMEIERNYIGECDQIITVNPAIVTELENRYQVKNVKVIYNAERKTNVPDNSRIFHKTLNLPPESKILLYQGGLLAGRHIEALVAAMALVRTPTIHLVILGDGQFRETLKKIRAKFGLAGRVHILDAVPQQELLLYTSSAEAGVIPYQANCMNNYVSTPNKMFEFIAASLPILSNDLPEIRKFVATYDIGMLGDMSAPAKIARLIDDFFSDPERYQRWRMNIKEARAKVCWEEEGKKVIALYDALRS